MGDNYQQDLPPPTPETPHRDKVATSTMHLSQDATAFVQLIGMPPPDLLDPTHTLGPGLASSKDAMAFNALAFPPLSGHSDIAATKFIDLIDASNEDPFVLETFESLITAHMEAGKDFLMARVLTMEDNKSDDASLDGRRLFYSYYAAHQINRTLFRTQPEEGLLHRMKAKNPMNNLTVVGDVHYYVIRASNPYGNSKRQSSKDSALGNVGVNKSSALVNDPDSTAVTVREMFRSPSFEVEEAAVDGDVDDNESVCSAPGNIETLDRPIAEEVTVLRRRNSTRSLISVSESIQLAAEKKRKTMADNNRSENSVYRTRSPAMKKLRASAVSIADESDGAAQSTTRTFVAHYYATDDDFLMRRYIREYFKQNALNAEDIFLFTLFGASQHNGESFSSPLVSDPTNPAAVAAPLDQAVKQHMELLARGPLSPSFREAMDPSADVNNNNSNSPHASTLTTIYRAIFGRWQSGLSGLRGDRGRRPYSQTLTASSAPQSPNNNSGALFPLGPVDVEMGLASESQATSTASSTAALMSGRRRNASFRNNMIRLLLVIAVPVMTVIVRYLTQDNDVAFVISFVALIIAFLTAWKAVELLH